jgi:glutamate formiminotransferase / formiminotetrahydrofolate cyclodeaminase
MSRHPVQLFECIPNISEGRDAAIVDALAETVSRIEGVRLLDRTSDPAHHRSVLTFAGDAPRLADAAVALVEHAVRLIDLRRHAGIHPRVGAVDVVPFVPLRDATMADALALSIEVGERIGRLGVPVFLYEHAASRPERSRLELIRRGGLDGLTHRMRAENWAPDFGPAAPHPAAGVAIVGARDLLVAWNLDLETNDLAIARAIAREIRASSGGLPGVKALGLYLPHRRRAQVSMNLTDFRVTPMHVVYERVAGAAERLGTRIHDSEIIGLVPREALAEAARHVPLLGERHRDQVLEDRIEACGL